MITVSIMKVLNSKIESLTASLNDALKKLENHPHKCCIIVEDNLFFLQKELLPKDDVIKSLVETQTAIQPPLNIKHRSISTTAQYQTPLNIKHHSISNTAQYQTPLSIKHRSISNIAQYQTPLNIKHRSISTTAQYQTPLQINKFLRLNENIKYNTKNSNK